MDGRAPIMSRRMPVFLRRSTLAACAAAMVLVVAGPIRDAAAQSEQLPSANGNSEDIASPPTDSIPGPNWVEDSGYPAQTPPSNDGWQVCYPFKYYPPGYPAAGGYSDASILLPPDGADACFCTPPPCYFGTFYFETVILDRRSNLDPTGLFFDNTGAVIASTSDLDFDTEAGLRFGLLLASPCGNDWMFEYFGITAFNDSITATDPLGTTGVYFGQALGPVTSLSAHYQSKLNSLEFSVRSRQMRRLAPIAGIRVLRLDESFDITTGAGQFSDAENDLFGFQFGFQGLLYDWGRWRLETTAKAGPYVNDIDVNVRPNSTNPAIVNKHVDHWHSAFVGDLRLGVSCRLGPRTNFRVGYQAMWLEGVALAPNQNGDISYATNRETVDLSGVIYQGGYLGLDLSW